MQRTYNNSASTFENIIFLYANNKSAGQPAHPHNLIITFVILSLQNVFSKVATSTISVSRCCKERQCSGNYMINIGRFVRCSSIIEYI